ncbi:MAG: type I restriction endonuclease subunit R [Anaerolineales bacterium]|nr:type I restriction endonuclease subunit R [Anaerolineales bacterium]
MSTVGQRERAIQNRVVALFRDRLKYTYLGNWEDRPENRNVEESLLRAFLKERKVKETLIGKALFELNKVAGDQNKSLYDVNKEVYSRLRYGVKVRPDAGENMETVWLVDWEHPQNNHFAIAEEVTINGQYTKRPDIVLYLNGIAVGVLELKRSTVSVEEGIRQNLDNQKKEFIQHFFTTNQLVMAGSDSQGLRYGSIETPEKYYLRWKEPGDDQANGHSPLLDRALTQLCARERLLELIHDFVAFDAGVKKLCRHNQYFAVRAAQERVRQREGGIIWHTQGSGKSMIMVWLAKWLREHVTGSRVLIITDRIELDEQIEGIFSGVGEGIHRTSSGADLIDCLNEAKPWLMCSLIHKFANREEGDVAGYIQELQNNLPPDFKAKGDIYVFVDECHRTQSGDLHRAMKAILPDAMLIGFTGTPLLKVDKQKSVEIFGRYIHTYKYDEAVKDGVVLDLRYEARDIDQYITSQEKIDQWFNVKTQGLTDVARAQIKQRWGTMQAVLSSKDRLEKIVADILFDMATRDRLQSGRGNALLVSGSIYQACKFYELFLSHGFEHCAIVTSYRPSAAAIKGEETGEGETEKLEQYEIYNKMLGGQDVEVFEKEAKRKFIKEPGQMKLLIVVDKLLTGFDAPPATYLYIDKHMQDHGLFQAICRVNRLDGEDKEYGYIVDYKDLFQSLEGAVKDYTSGAFDAYDKEDVVGLLSNRLDKAREHLEETRETIKALCEAVPAPKGTLEYQHYFCALDTSEKNALKENEPKRVALYKMTASLVRAYANLANEMTEAGYSEAESETIRREVEYYEKVRLEVKLASGDYVDMKMYEPAMRHLIDTYIRAEDSRKLSAFDDMTLIQLIIERGADAFRDVPEGIASNPEAMAEAIENNLRRVIIDEQPINPRYYERMSELLDGLIRERKAKALEYEAYLAQLVGLTHQVANPAGGGIRYPRSLNTAARRALYDNLGTDEALALAIDQKILSTRHADWRGNMIKEREVKYAIAELISDDAEAARIFELVKNQQEY